MSTKVTSVKWQLIKQDLPGVLKGALIAGVGAGLTYLLGWVNSLDFGALEITVTAGLAVLTNIVRKWFTVNEY